MNELVAIAPFAGSAAQLVVAFVLLAFAVLGTGARLRSLAVCLAVLLVVPVLFAWPAGVPEAREALPAIGVLVSALAGIVAAAIAVSLALDRLSHGQSPSLRAAALAQRADERVRDARQQKLRGLLKREHEKLETVTQMHRYLELATRNSQITVFYQDAELRYRWIVNPRIALTPENVLDKTDDEALPEPVRPLVVGHKRRALATNTTQTFEVELPNREERSWFRVDVVPVAEGGNEPIGIVCTAIDITRSKRLDMMRTDLSRRLAETLQRFNLALRSERIMVFSQDLELRYTWANSDETQVGSIIGRTDEDVLPEADREPIVRLKRQVIETRRPAAAEIGVGSGAERRWYDLNVEPNLRPDGTVAGITCASIDITHRKRNEEQMRLVMRELTHRTKNLLAVVIAIARQTAGQTSTIDTFVPALVARLRALSAAQDLIVADDWAGVYISDLIRVLIGQYVPPQSARVAISGPSVMLSPEASQNLGLAIHELAANAVQYGAFANTVGTLSITWECVTTPGGDQLRLTWTEEGGPQVTEPTTRGFGMMVIERNLSRALGAEVDMSFDAKGLTVTIVLPLQGVVPLPGPDRVQLAKVS